MRPALIPILVGVALVVTPLAARAQSAAESGVARVTSLESGRRAAMVAGDVKTLGELMATDATYVHSTGLIQTRDELFAMLTRGETRYVGFTVDAVEYRSYGETVIATGVQSIDLASAGKPLMSRSRYTVVYAPVGGELKMVAYQSTPLTGIVTREKP